jgi:hypothetical protein
MGPGKFHPLLSSALTVPLRGLAFIVSKHSKLKTIIPKRCPLYATIHYRLSTIDHPFLPAVNLGNLRLIFLSFLYAVR